MPRRQPRRPPATPTVGLFAPSGHLSDPARLDRAVTRLEGLGWGVVVDATARGQWRRFAAPDAERIAGLYRLLDDPRVDLLLALRGGYGLTRLLDALDYARIAAAGKPIVGFSDLTLLQLALLAQADYGSLHGPMAAADFGATAPDAWTCERFMQVLASDAHALDAIACPHPYPARVLTGTLWGGNLACVASLAGTPWLPRPDAGIVFLEDVNEPPYRIERLLLQLLQAGAFAGARALLLGDFTHGDGPAHEPDYSLAEVVVELRARLPCPVLTGLPIGHGARRATLPQGAPAELALDAAGYTLAFSDYWA